MTDSKPFTFKQLVAKEDAARRTADDPELDVYVDGVEADEPWVSFTNRDRVGLALSGGGIRSASFNLGVLQTLAHRGVLKRVDYVSTVSGGGYVGGFLSALHKAGKDATKILQHVRVNASTEPAELRHLRQFSRFLVPKIGSTRLETWAGVLAVVGGALPTMAMMAAALVVACAIFLAVTFPATSLLTTAVFLVALALAGSVFVEAWGLRRVENPAPWWHFFGLSLLAGLIAVVSLELSPLAVLIDRPPDQSFNELFAIQTGARLHLWLFRPSALLGSTAAFAFLVRLLSSRADKRWHPLLDRITIWHLATAAFWAVGVGLWEASRIGLGARFQVAGASGVVTGGLFLWFRDWLLQKPEDTRISGVMARALSVVKLGTPRILAFAAVLAFLLAGIGAYQQGVGALTRNLLSVPRFAHVSANVGSCLEQVVESLKPAALSDLPMTLRRCGAEAERSQWGDLPSGAFECAEGSGRAEWLASQVGRAFAVLLFFVGGVVILALLGWFVDPSKVGLHAFYRRRIARAFLGAARASSGVPTRTAADQDDDFLFSELAGDRNAPVHLVCCTANDVQGDSLRNLGRGGRSATLSPHGIALGGFAKHPGKVTLAEALTASAAALNSQMGSFSMEFGRAVSILTSGFNLRLGLWVEHPLAPNPDGLWPLRMLFMEAAGLTECKPLVDADVVKAWLETTEPYPPARPPSGSLGESHPPLHLSDGGHFENLALYELVRRHCRYIIVCDASADPDCAFDDLGNAIRRIREDFSVEIEINVNPLRPVAGRSKQSAVIGTIHYDGLAGSDKGTILYLKPTLVGTEPPDVLQYHSRNVSFPHQGTSDQFYDEAQWESYRRLGEYEMAVALSVVESDWQSKNQPVDALFLSLQQGWHPAPPQNTETFLEFTERCSELETEVRGSAPVAFRAEMFPELAIGQTPPEPMNAEETAKVITLVMQIAQLMEDVWLAAQFDRYWSHPLNQGWMTYFHRWANCPSFRVFWPLLRGIYSNGFRNFVRDRFQLHVADELKDSHDPVGTLVLCDDGAEWRDGEALMALRSDAWSSQPTLRYGLRLHPSADTRFAALPKLIPVATLSAVEGIGEVSWRARDLRVPPWLLGNGIQARFLDRIIKHYKGKPLRVTFEDGHRDPGLRAERTQAIAFYKSRKFTYERQADGAIHLVRSNFTAHEE